MRANTKLPKAARSASPDAPSRIEAPTKAPIPPALRTEHPYIGPRPIGVPAPETRKIAQILELLAYPFTHGPATWAGILATSALGALCGFFLAVLLHKWLGGAQ